MRLYYQPKGYWFGDCMPFGKGDTFYLFHQRDTRKPCPFGEPFGWDLATTKDFVTYEDCGTAILRGDDTKQDQFIFAGSVCEDRDGVYHAFYTGFNRDYPKQGKPSQVLMHAISHDLKNWEKTNDAVTFTPQPGYDPDDWRDPFVLWDDEENQYILILGTRLAGDKHRQTGRTVYFTSTDLTNWTFEGDFWAPDLFTMHEMPDLFKIGEWWYLITTEYSHASKQVYRMAKSLKGPWIAPEDDGFDGRAYYAGRTFELNGQRIIFGWVPSRANETDSAHLTYDENSDNEQFIWAGTFVAHEIYQREDGTLGCRVPQTVWDAFKEKTVLADETLKRESGRVTKQVVSNAGDCYRFETTVTVKDGLRSFSVGLRDNEETGVSYCFTVLCAQNRVIFEKVPNWPWPQMNNIGLERPVHPNEDGTYHIQIIADDTIATLYINGVALNARMYTQPGDGIVLAAEDGTAVFKDMSFTGKESALLMGRRIEPRLLMDREGRFFSRNRLLSEKKSLAVAVLMDESGSMADQDRVTYARAAGIIIYDFCKAMDVPILIMGHTDDSNVQLYAYTDFDSMDKMDRYRLMDLSARYGNRDGAALRYVAERLLKQPEEKKLLLLVSDGQPAGTGGYLGSAAEADLRGIKKEYTNKGILFVAAAIGDDKENIERIYGDAFLDISDLTKLPFLLVKKIEKELKG